MAAAAAAVADAEDAAGAAALEAAAGLEAAAAALPLEVVRALEAVGGAFSLALAAAAAAAAAAVVGAAAAGHGEDARSANQATFRLPRHAQVVRAGFDNARSGNDVLFAELRR